MLRTAAARPPLAVVAGLAATLCAACAGLRPAAGGTRTVYEESALGYRFELPDASFRTVEEGRGVVSGDLAVRVFPLFPLGGTRSDCLAALLAGQVLPDDLAAPVASPEELERRGREGLDHGDRTLFLAVHPRHEACLVVAVDGAREARTDEAAQVILGTFRPGVPDTSMRPLLLTQSGWELLRAHRAPEALARFEAALAYPDAAGRARIGAGLAAAAMGREGAAKAIEHLGRLAGGSDIPLEADAYRDTLMHLGLAEAWLERFTAAKQHLAEASVRFPGDATVAYNLACIQALSGDADEALYQLGVAFRGDPALVEHARTDDDLVSLHTLDAFRALVPPTEQP